MSKVGIVIVNYNGAKFQNDCIRTILEMDYKNIEIILVDNNSSDNSVELTMNQYGEYITLLKQDDNYGIAKGNNIGIQYCIDNSIDYTLLMNNDVELDKRLLTLLMEQVNENTVVVPKIYFYEPNDMLWFAGGNMNWNRRMAEHYGLHEYESEQYNEIKEITYSPTCCMLIPTSLFKKIGLMDETVFMYWDDTDLCARMIDAGYKIIYEPNAIMWHKVSSSSGGEDSRLQIYYSTRNKLYFMKKYKKKISFGTRLYIYLKDFAKFILSPVRKKNDKVIFKAYCHYVGKKMGRCDNI